MGKIVRVYRSVCTPIPQLLQRLSAILKDLAIDGFDLTVRRQGPNETGDSVNCRAQTSLAFTLRLLRTFALGQIEDERKALVTSLLERCDANKHRHTTAIFSKILLLEGLDDPC